MPDIAVICLVVTALAAWFNARFVHLPNTIGVMVIAMLLSLALLGANALGFSEWYQYERALMKEVDFTEVLMNGMLSLLLFASALHVDVSLLKRYRWQVARLAFLGTLVSTLIVGFVLYWALPLVGMPLSLGYCLVFGALISPTDPIAVTGILKSAGAPENVNLVVSGESLFNDGVGVVLFTLMLGMVAHHQAPTAQDALWLLLREAGGGLLLGALLGAVLVALLRSVDEPSVKVMLTLAGVLGGYALANRLHVSGPLAMVVVGLAVAYRGQHLAKNNLGRRYVDVFWSLLDEILNAVLFVLIGLEIVLVELDSAFLRAGLVAVLVALGARMFAVGAPLTLFPHWFHLPKGAWKVLAWGGLRGGISVALALSLPASAERDLLLTMTYAVVVFSILVQGTTIGRVTRRVLGTSEAKADDAA